ncbi:amidohydrolase family protein, partial [Streptococcus sp.]|uniref:amidohydrolase family protein n=1 Tax=Streptococcus sp. TaxID=1306 RepID=UPI00179C54B6
GIASKTLAINMASLTAAISVGLDDKCGQIKKGRLADFIVLDKDLDLRATYLGGQEAWKA